VPSTIWTPRAVASKSVSRTLKLWRAVEAQHVASTRRLTDTADEQILLENLLESSKPPLPPEAAALGYLLATPFRYPSPYGSRFRAPDDPGAWYGAEEPRTACAELGYWRWRFLLDSEGLNGLGPSAQTVFQAGLRGSVVDLTKAPFVRDSKRWMHPGDYGPTQAFGRTVRESKVDIIRYASVRDPQHAACGAALTPVAFHPRKPLAQRTWFLTVSKTRVTWQRDGEVYDFDTGVFDKA
jgi:RES domain